MLGYVIYEGPSRLDGEPIVVILTLDSGNTKTGPMDQVWILLQNVHPTSAIREERDGAICGDCPLRPKDNRANGCYVNTLRGPGVVWNSYRANRYERGVSPREIGRDRIMRLGAYGDPGAVPTRVWADLVRDAKGWTGYTHAWRKRPSLRPYVMASVESRAAAAWARLRGWRTFRVYQKAGVVKGEVACPASAESGHRVQCIDCLLCAGTSRPAKSIAIRAHGWNGHRVQAD